MNVLGADCMERADPANRDEFYWAIMGMIPDRLVGAELFRRKFGAKV